MKSCAIQMDPIEGLNPQRDSTLVLALEAQRRGYELFYYTPDKLTWREGKVVANGYRVKIIPDPKHYYELGESLTLDLQTMDVVLLRQDPPFNMNYITTTYLLEMLMPKTLVVNHPASVRNYTEKLFPLLFSKFMPPTLISADAQEIEEFRARHKDIILKPLYGYGGRAVLRFKPDDDNFHAALEMHFSASHDVLVVQKFLPEVKTGDRRIILIDGKLGGVMGRIPAEHEIRANFRVGGSAAKAELTPKQREICEVVGPVLKEKGLLFAGLDVIGDWLTEINLTSPTGLVQMNALYGLKLESDIWDAIENVIPA